MNELHLIVSYGPFPSPESYAYVLNWIADFMEADQPTSYTNDRVHAALARVHAASDAQLEAAAVIRGRRRKRKARRIKL